MERESSVILTERRASVVWLGSGALIPDKRRGGLTGMTKVVIRDGESLDAALRRFKKDLAKSGVLRDARRHEHYEKPSEKKRRLKMKRERKGR